MSDEEKQTKIREQFEKKQDAMHLVKHFICQASDAELTNGEVFYVLDKMVGSPDVVSWLRDEIGPKPS